MYTTRENAMSIGRVCIPGGGCSVYRKSEYHHGGSDVYRKSLNTAREAEVSIGRV